MILGERFKKFRKLKKMTQKEVSALLGLNIRTYQKYESGEITPNFNMLNNISGVFEIDIHYLLSDEYDVHSANCGDDGLFDEVYDRSYEKFMSILCSYDDEISEYLRENLQDLLHGLSLDFIYDDIEDLVYVESTDTLEEMDTVVVSPEGFLTMLRSIISFKSVFMKTSKDSSMNIGDVTECLLERGLPR